MNSPAVSIDVKAVRTSSVAASQARARGKHGANGFPARSLPASARKVTRVNSPVDSSHHLGRSRRLRGDSGEPRTRGACAPIIGQEAVQIHNLALGPVSLVT